MQSDAKALGLNIYIASGYRSYQYQVNLYDRYVSTSGKEKADTYSSRPGHSEHQTGMCFDLNSIEDSLLILMKENGYMRMLIVMDLSFVFLKGQKNILVINMSHGICVM